MLVAFRRLLTAALAVLPGAGGADASLVQQGTCRQQVRCVRRVLCSGWVPQNHPRLQAVMRYTTGACSAQQQGVLAAAVSQCVTDCAHGVCWWVCCAAAAHRLADDSEVVDQQLVVVGNLHQAVLAVAVVDAAVRLGLHTTAAAAANQPGSTAQPSGGCLTDASIMMCRWEGCLKCFQDVPPSVLACESSQIYVALTLTV